MREVVRREATGDRIVMEVRFAFTGSVSSAVRAVIDPQKMSWITRTEILVAERRSSWVVLPDHYPDRLSADGTYRFEEGAGGPGTTEVEVEGELKVRVPIVGRSVEKVIVNGPAGLHRRRGGRHRRLGRADPQPPGWSHTLSIWVMPSSMPPARMSMSAVES